MAEVRIAQVLVDMRGKGVDRLFTYLVPAHLKDAIQIGQRVSVPFGRQQRQGFVISLEDTDEPTTNLRALGPPLDAEPLLTEEMIDLCRWLRWRYVCSWLEAVHTMLPAAYRARPVHRYQALVPSASLDEGEGAAADVDSKHESALSPAAAEVWRALCESAATLEQLERRFGGEVWLILEQLKAQGLVTEVTVGEDRVRARQVTYLEATASAAELRQEAARRERRARRQAHLLRELAGAGRVQLTTLGLHSSDPPVQALVKAGLARLVAVETYRAPDAGLATEDQPDRPLTPSQERALARIRAVLTGTARVRELVMHGVTGSGKTEVFLRAIADVVAEGGGAIVLVPEISLTPQMVGRFVARFGQSVAVLHSGLSAGERRDEWLRVRRGEAKIVVGARSAVFAPVQQLRLIVVDEEHEPSYKQEESPRYDAREVARLRANADGRAVVFASATPSVRVVQRVESGLAELVSLPRRVNGRPLPQVEVVDMREELKSGNRSLFSRALQEGLAATVAAGQQAILFLNRRGYAAFVLCRNCGHLLQCPHCDISLTLHREQGRARLHCHYCGYQCAHTATCPSCAEPALRPFGIGTQQVEQSLCERWPEYRVLRMDVDTTRRKGAHQEVLQRFLAGEADILLGTQMIAKGLDFPNVSFVGVLAADTMLAVPDYRAAERTFDLLTQVAGRAGRAETDGRTVVQTYRPEHYAIITAANHDYASFYRQERELREQFGYPPFCELAVFLAVHREERLAAAAARRFERELRRRLSSEQVGILPAHVAGVAKVEDQYRYQVVIKYTHWQSVAKEVANAFHLVREKMRRLDGTCTLDVDAGRIA
jgi:primosomal protein N' (replication factor Y)